jgi:hypothetical protein
MQSPINAAEDSVLPPDDISVMAPNDIADDISVMAVHDAQPGASAGKKAVIWDQWFPQSLDSGTLVLSLM